MGKSEGGYKLGHYWNKLESSGNGKMGSYSRHIWKAESVRPADRMGVGCKRRGLWCLG